MSREISVAESWERVYDEFQQINFSAFDYNSVKQSLIDYIKTYHPENFNDFIEDSEMIVLIEAFAYIAELMAYRYDMNAHENFMSTAQRRQSVLRLAKFLSYNPTRNLPARGLVKLNSVTTTEQVFDSRGVNLANTKIVWNDPNNPLWKEQFFQVMNSIMSQEFGSVKPNERVQVDDVVFELYTLNNDQLTNGVVSYSALANGRTYPMELVPSALNELGPYEKRPMRSDQFSILYGSDGIGDASDTTGFFMFTKQGILQRIAREYDGITPNQTEIIDQDNINDTDVWLNNINPDTGEIVDVTTIGNSISRFKSQSGKWVQVSRESDNVLFNNEQQRTKFEIETLENDQIKIIFGDGEFADIPKGTFDIWFRQSANADVIIPALSVSEKSGSMRYTSASNRTETFNFTFSLVNALTNSSATESVDTIKRVASLVYATQDRMVSGSDYNNFPLKEPSILKLVTFNRTFSGESRYMKWHDASGHYEDIKVVGDDLVVYQEEVVQSIPIRQNIQPNVALANFVQPALTSPGLIAFHEVNRLAAPSREFTTQERLDILNEIDVIEQASGVGYPIRLVYIQPDQRATVVVSASSPLLLSTSLSIPSVLHAFTLTVNDVEHAITVDGTSISTVSTLINELNNAVNSAYVEVSLIDGNLVFRSTSTGENANVSIVDGSDSIIAASLFQALNSSLLLNSPATVLTIEPGIEGVSIPTWRPFQSGLTLTQPHSFDITWVDSQEWSVFYNAVNTVAYSPTTRFYFSNNDPVISSTTGLVNEDKLILLQANINRDRTGIQTAPYSFDVISNPTNTVSPNIGIADTSKLLVTSPDVNGDGLVDETNLDVLLDQRVSLLELASITSVGNYDVFSLPSIPGLADFSYTVGYGDIDVLWQDTLINEGSDFYLCDVAGVSLPAGSSGTHIAVRQDYADSVVFKRDYVYFSRQSEDDEFIFAPTTPGVRDTWYSQQTSSAPLVIRHRGRSGYNFMWIHITPRFNLVNPSPTNIHDMYIITKGYYSMVQDWLQNDATEPQKPTPLQLKNDYAQLLGAQMMSDEVVLHCGDFKVLFGSKASPQLRAKIKVIKSKGSNLTDNEIKVNVVNIVRDFFNIAGWNFGETFYFSELASVITARLAGDIKSAVLVPTSNAHVFGDLYEVRSAQNEVFQPHITVGDVEVVDSLNARILRQG